MRERSRREGRKGKIDDDEGRGGQLDNTKREKQLIMRNKRTKPPPNPS